MKRIFGSLGVVLGAVGILACLAGVVFVWWFSTRYLSQASETARAVESILTTANTRFARLNAGVTETRQRIAGVRDAARAVAKDGSRADPAFKARVEALATSLVARIERAEDMATMLNGTVEVVATMTENAKTTDDLRAAEAVLKKTAASLEDVRQKLADASAEENIERAAKGVENLADSLEAVLNEVARGVGEVTGLLAKGRTEVESLRKALVFWQTWGPTLLTLILVWVALGQVALLAWCWSWLRG